MYRLLRGWDLVHFLTKLDGLKIISVMLLAFVINFDACAQAFVTSGQQWENASTDVYINFDVTNPSTNPINSNGPSNTEFQNAFIAAMNAWNTASAFQWFPNTSGSAVDPCANPNNGVKFETSSCLGGFGSTTLAVQSSSWSVPSNFYNKTTTVFNNTKVWNIYSGSGGGNDFTRVAVHELGHGLGLNHSDSGNIMFANTGSTEVPQAGDIAGVAAIYGSGGGADVDGDGINNGADNCPINPNNLQTDTDNDGFGDLCDLDFEGDGFVDDLDNCPSVANAGQEDFDADNAGDACDPDADGDGVFNAAAVDTSHDVEPLGNIFWPAGPSSQSNSDFSFYGQTFQAQFTGDLTQVDLPLHCPLGNVEIQIRTVANNRPSSTVLGATTFLAGAGVLPSSRSGLIRFPLDNTVAVTSGTNYSIVVSISGACILLQAPSAYAQGAGYLGTPEEFWSAINNDYSFQVFVNPLPTDNCPLIPNPSQQDSNNNGIGDACDIMDQDGDGIDDATDNCPADPNSGQEDNDLDGAGDVCDLDDDNDDLTDLDELNIYGTSPTIADTDIDGLDDGAEVNVHSTDPLDKDSDDDGVNDGDEVAAGTDPNVPTAAVRTVPLLTPFAALIFAMLLLHSGRHRLARARGT